MTAVSYLLQHLIVCQNRLHSIMQNTENAVVAVHNQSVRRQYESALAACSLLSNSHAKHHAEDSLCCSDCA